MTLRDWRDGLLAGTVLGAVVLGAGGRAVMRVAALAVWQEPTFTVSGSATVVGAGAIRQSIFAGWSCFFRWPRRSTSR